MKNLIIASAFLFLSFLGVAKVHEFYVWDGYYRFYKAELSDVIYVGDTLRWVPLGGGAPEMAHTITSTTIPEGAVSFDVPWEGPEIPTFEYVVTVAGVYDYVCTPHVDFGMIDQFEVKAIVSSLGDPFTLVDFELYPSPAHDKLFIDEILILTNYSVIGSNGQIIQTGVTIGEIDISELKTGVYFLLFHEDKNRGTRFYKE